MSSSPAPRTRSVVRHGVALGTPALLSAAWPGAARAAEADGVLPGGRVSARRALGASAALLVLFAAVGVLVVRQTERLRAHEQGEAASQIAASAAFALERQISRSMSATYTLAAIVRQRGSIDDFDALAAGMLPVYGGLSSLQLAPGAVVSQIYPLAGSEAALGHDLLHDPDRRFQTLAAIESRQLTVAGPFTMRQGGVGLVGRLAVFRPDPDRSAHGRERFWGLVTAVVRLSDLIEEAQLGRLTDGGYAYQLTRVDPQTGAVLGIAGDLERTVRDPVSFPVKVPNGEWTLAVAPARGWSASRWLLVQYVLAFVGALALAALAFGVLQRTADLARVNVQLAADVERRDRAEAALTLTQQVVDRASLGVAWVDEDDRVAYANDAFARSSGRPAGELCGEPIWEVFPPVSEDEWVAARKDLARSDSTSLNVRLATGAATRDVRVSIDRVEVREGHLVVVYVRDVTEQRRAEEQFRQAQKMEAIGQLAGGVAHDFNNLLTVILGCAEALKQAVDSGSPPEVEDIAEIRAAGQRASELTRQLLAFARKQVTTPVPLDLNALVPGAEKLLRRVLGEDIKLAATLQPDLWTVRCDPGQIEQVILNLAVNARDAMPGGGKLTIETRNVEIGADLVAPHPWMRTGPHVLLAVRDSGQGMSPEVKARIFEPFFTTKPQGKGTGLGLATVYGIVKQSEGYILVESEPGWGTTFEIYFPRVMEAPVAAAPPGRATAMRGTETVLVVEDDPQVREVTIRSLRSGGYRVLVAAGGREALDVEASEQGPLHLLVSDVVMPGLSGPETADELRRRRPELRVLFVSGYTRDAVIQRGVHDAGIELLPKPFTASSLLSRVRAVLDAH
jgi:PAS domain S-box-containing protein